MYYVCKPYMLYAVTVFYVVAIMKVTSVPDVNKADINTQL